MLLPLVQSALCVWPVVVCKLDSPELDCNAEAETVWHFLNVPSTVGLQVLLNGSSSYSCPTLSLT